MKWIVIAIFALTTPVLAEPLSHRHCTEIEVEIRRAATEGTIPERVANVLIKRCNNSKDWNDDSSKVRETNEESRDGDLT